MNALSWIEHIHFANLTEHSFGQKVGKKIFISLTPRFCLAIISHNIYFLTTIHNLKFYDNYTGNDEDMNGTPLLHRESGVLRTRQECATITHLRAVPSNIATSDS